MAKTRKIALFEPWGLGDLAISLHLARAAHAQGIAVTLFCDPRYVEWARDFPFVAEAVGISVPWVRKSGKYAVLGYPWRAWRELRRKFGTAGFDFVIEPRRDPRAALLLAFLGIGPRKTSATRAEGLGYHRLALLPATIPEKLPVRAPGDSVVCFFGAEWANRRVPAEKITEILDSLAAAGRKVGVILPPEEAESSLYQGLRHARPEIAWISGSVREVATRMKEFSLGISTDSGWLHVAALQGLRTVGLFGFTNDDDWNPPGGEALRAEHCLPGDARYSPAAESLRPLGTLRVAYFSAALKRLAH